MVAAALEVRERLTRLNSRVREDRPAARGCTWRCWSDRRRGKQAKDFAHTVASTMVNDSPVATPRRQRRRNDAYRLRATTASPFAVRRSTRAQPSRAVHDWPNSLAAQPLPCQPAAAARAAAPAWASDAARSEAWLPERSFASGMQARCCAGAQRLRTADRRTILGRLAGGAASGQAAQRRAVRRRLLQRTTSMWSADRWPKRFADDVARCRYGHA